MQDGAPGHAKKETIADLIKRGITKINWPPFSLDLNPIETVWNWIKEWIWNHYPYNFMLYDQLRKAILEAWEAVPKDWLIKLVREIRERC